MVFDVDCRIGGDEHNRSREGVHAARGARGRGGARGRIAHGDLGGGGQRSREGWCDGREGEDLKK